jgi:hypothetical protein
VCGGKHIGFALIDTQARNTGEGANVIECGIDGGNVLCGDSEVIGKGEVVNIVYARERREEGIIDNDKEKRRE